MTGVTVPWGLLWTLVRTDFKTRYHGTLGGYVWALLKPLSMFLVLWGVFSFVFRSDNDYSLNLVIGLFLYEFFSEASKAALVALRTKSFLLTRSRFPAWVLVITSTSNAAITLGVFTLALVIVLALIGRTPSAASLALFVLYELWLFAIIIAVTLAGSVLFLRYRDLNQVWELVIQAGFFVAPIIYPLATLPHEVHAYLFLWPPTPAIAFARDVLVAGAVPSATAHIYLGIEAGVLLTAGWLVYRRFAPRAAEYL